MSKKTLISFLLDESGSMQDHRSVTIAGFNTYLDTLRGTDKEVDVDMTLTKFMTSDYYTHVFKNLNIGKVPYLTAAGYNPCGGTAICDAGMRCIDEMEQTQGSEDCNVVIVIQTDGEEGRGRYSLEDLRKKIDQKRSQGWKFVFMGCGIDAYSMGQKMGVSQDMTSSYDGKNSEAAFENLAKNTVKYVHSGSENDLKYDKEQRKKQGDKYAK